MVKLCRRPGGAGGRAEAFRRAARRYAGPAVAAATDARHRQTRHDNRHERPRNRRRGKDQFGIGKISTRLLAWSTITARLVNWSMATPNCGEPPRPKVLRVLKGFEMVSMIETVWLAELIVKMPPVCGLMASEVGLIPTWTVEVTPVSGLKVLTTLPALDVA